MMGKIFFFLFRFFSNGLPREAAGHFWNAMYFIRHFSFF
jgi:hypothetical protein